jgi:hypothetical protein
MSALVPLAGTSACARVRLSSHAVERYVERVAPALSPNTARAALTGAAAAGVVLSGAPLWSRNARHQHQMHLVIADVCFPLAADRADPEVLVAVTCIPRGMRAPDGVGRRANALRRRRLARREANASPKAA